MPKVRKPTRQRNGLLDLFGLSYRDDDPNFPGSVLQYQFRVIRRMHGDRYVVQLFSWMDGGPTEVMVMSEQQLLGDKVKLYASEELWRIGAEKQQRREQRGHLRSAS